MLAGLFVRQKIQLLFFQYTKHPPMSISTLKNTMEVPQNEYSVVFP